MRSRSICALLACAPIAAGATPIQWESEKSSAKPLQREPLIWKMLPADGSENQIPNWQVLPSTENPAQSPSVIWEQLPDDAPDLAPTKLPPIPPPPRPPAPVIQSFNRSIAFDDGTVGPDVAWIVPQGFRWSSTQYLDGSVLGFNRRGASSSFWGWNNGDAVAQIHARLLQHKKMSFGINASFRSVYQGSEFSGGSTSIGDGFSSGFRFDYSLSDTTGIAFGAEQLIHYDDQTDTGRNIYLVFSKGWWLGQFYSSYPLLISTVGLGSGSLALNPDLNVACIDTPGGAGTSTTRYSPLCWGPIASASLVFNPYLSLIGEFNSDYIAVGSSLALSNTLPMRLTAGLLVADQGTGYSYVGNDNLRWFFRISLGL